MEEVNITKDVISRSILRREIYSGTNKRRSLLIRYAKSFGMTALAVLVLQNSTLATEQPKPFTYSPEHCNFTITFPGEPYTIERCDEKDEKKCYNLVSYTHTYDMSSTVNFRVICSKVDESLYKTYSAEIMAATLKAMTDHNIIKTYDLSYREETGDGYKQAGLVGEGKSGKLSTMYIAQLWIGNHSALSVEAELIGDQHPEADKLFTDVLKSVYFKNPEKEGEAEQEEKEETTSPTP